MTGIIHNQRGSLNTEGIQSVYTSSFSQPTQATRTIDYILANLEYGGRNEPPRKFDQREIALMLGIRWNDGFQVLTMDNPELVYEFTSICIQSPNIEMACININHVTSKVAREFGAKIILDTFPFVKEWNEYIADIDRAKNAIDLIEGEIQCKKCGSLRTNTVRIQMRSADEPTTVKSICHACGFRWTS